MDTLAGETGWPGGAEHCRGVKHVGGGRAPRATASALSCPRPTSLQPPPPVASVSPLVLGGANTARTPLLSSPLCPLCLVSQWLRGRGALAPEGPFVKFL